MRHYIMIRAAYSDPVISKTRLRVSEATIIPSLRSQTDRRFEVIVRMSERDPLTMARKSAFRLIGVPVHFIQAATDKPITVNDNCILGGPWDAAIGERTTQLLQTRVDDDDALAKSFTARLHKAPALSGRRVLTFPRGYVTDGERVASRRYPGNQFPTLKTDPGDTLGVYDQTHNDLVKHVRVQVVDNDPAWLWIRHPGAISVLNGRTYAFTPVDLVRNKAGVRSLFDVDWECIRALQGSRKES